MPCFRAEASEEGPQTHLMVASDLHYLSPSLTDHGSCFTELVRNGDGKVMEYSQELVEMGLRPFLTGRGNGLCPGSIGHSQVPSSCKQRHQQVKKFEMGTGR